MTSRAVCVGVNRFSDAAIPPLEGCVNDAKQLATVLSRLGGFQEGDIKTITDAQATKANVLRAIEWLTLSSSPGDTLLLYLSTYGSQWPSPTGQDRDGFDEIFVLHDHSWQFSVLRDDEVVDKLKRAPAGAHVVCILDTACAGPLPPPRAPGQFGVLPLTVQGRFLAPPADAPSVIQARQRGLSLRSRIRRQEGDENFVCVMASDSDEPVVEVAGTGGIGGAFTHSLVEALSAGGASKRWEDLTADVTRALRAKGQKQSPRVLIPDGLRGVPALGGTQSGTGAVGAVAVAPSGLAPSAPTPVAMSSPGIAAPIPAPMPPIGDTGSTSMVAVAGTLAAGAAAVGLGSFFGGSGSSSGSAMPGAMTAPSPSALLSPNAPVVDKTLAEFGPEAVTVRVCNAAMSVVPFAPKTSHYGSVDDALRALYPQATAPVVARVHQLAASESVGAAMKTVELLDMGDSGIALFSGVKSAIGLVTGGGLGALETDTQQGVDAALKLLGLAYFIHRLYPGTVQEKIQLFHTTPAGQTLEIYYAAIEVALPFADNLASGGAGLIQRIFSSNGAAAASKLGGMVGAEGAAQAQGLMGSLIGPFEQTLSAVAPHARSIAGSMGRFMGSAMNVADKAAGVVATAADALPMYRYLGARVAAESCVLLASRGM
ncbi:MAG: caspase family protein [Polyangiaceae bacterium]